MSTFGIFFSCDNNQNLVEPNTELKNFSAIEGKIIDFDSLKAILPIGYPEELIKFTPDDLQRIGNSKSSNKNLREEGFSNVDEIFKYLDNKYPPFDNFKAENYKPYFPNLSIPEIQNNYNNVVEYIEKLRAYDFAIAFQSLPLEQNKQSKNLRSGDYIKKKIEYLKDNAPEFWYYVAHQRMDKSGLKLAYDLAFAEQASKYPTYGKEDDLGDAFRHGVWGAYVAKHGCYRYGTVLDAKNVATGFLNAHEKKSTGDGRTMDENNNEISLNYWQNNAVNYRKSLWEGWNVRTNLSDSQISNYMFSSYKQKLNTAQDIVNYRSAGNRTIVYLK